MPDTASYYHAAYVIAAALYGGYAASIWRRARKVTKERIPAPRP